MTFNPFQNHTVPTLVLAEIFLPTVGGSVNWMINTYGRYPTGQVVLVAPKLASECGERQDLLFPVKRLSTTFSTLDPFSKAFLLEYFPAFREIFKWCKEYRIQQIHCAKVLPEGVLALGMKYILGIPFCVYAHGEEIPIGKTSRKLSWLMPRIYHQAATIIANSNNTRKLLIEMGIGREKVHVIHPGVDQEILQKSASSSHEIRRRLGIEGCPVLLVVGRLQRRKGHDNLIRALPLIREKYPTALCLIVGTGQEEEYLKEIVREVGVVSGVHFVGYVPDNELGGYYAACDIFIMPNRQIEEDIEGFGMVFLEAGSLGKPVIGGKSGGTNDAIVDGVTGLLVDGTFPEEIAQAVIFLLANPEKAAAMGKNGLRRVEQDFSWDMVSQKTKDLVASIESGSLRTAEGY